MFAEASDKLALQLHQSSALVSSSILSATPSVPLFGPSYTQLHHFSPLKSSTLGHTH